MIKLNQKQQPLFDQLMGNKEYKDAFISMVVMGKIHSKKSTQYMVTEILNVTLELEHSISGDTKNKPEGNQPGFTKGGFNF